MSCNERARATAYADGELGDAEKQAFARHLETCADCRADIAFAQASRAALRTEARTVTAGDALRRRIDAALEREDTAAREPRKPRVPVRSFWWGALAGAVTTACLCTIVIVGVPRLRDGDIDAMVADHTTAMANDLLLSVKSTDHHTVKPWLAGRADVSPLVEDYAANGFELLGARAVRIGGARSAVLVYRHGPHVIDVYVSPAGTLGAARETSRLGYHVKCWTHADLCYCAVSDTAWSEVRAFAALATASRDEP